MDNPFDEKKTSNPFEKKENEPLKENHKVVEEEKKVESSSLVVEEKDGGLINKDITGDRNIDEKPITEVSKSKSRKQAILDKHGGLESNVPLNSAYWNLKN